MDQIDQLVVGAGPVGSTTALKLAELGHRVKVLTRSGNGPIHPNIKLVAGDANDCDILEQHLDGATALVNAANPPYHRWPQDWPPIHAAMCTAAERTGALLVVMDNLYAFGSSTQMPMTESTPMNPVGRKGRVRAEMTQSLLQAHESGKLRAAIVRGSDFYGPGVIDSAFGERFAPKVIAAKKVSLLGSLDVPHSISYIPDVAATIAAVITQNHSGGKTWLVPNAPAVTQRRIVEIFADAAGSAARVTTVPRSIITLGGVFNPMARELREIWYQFAEPWVTDSSHTETVLGVRATSLTEGAAATIDFWRGRESN